MPVTVVTSDAPRTLRYTFAGDWPTSREHSDTSAQLRAAGHLTANTKALFDIRAAENLPHLNEMDHASGLTTANARWPLVRGFLVNEGVQFGVARQMQMVAPYDLSIYIFTGAAEAESWLCSESALKQGVEE